jgi:dienelactone hydrolase
MTRLSRITCFSTLSAVALVLLAGLVCARGDGEAGATKFEAVTLDQGGPPATVHLAYRPGTVPRHPVVLMLGALKPDNLPAWSADLVAEGYMLAAFSVAHPPDPDPARRPQWLVFDRRFAHSYVQGGYRAPQDARRVIEYLQKRGDVHPDKIGWLGSSSTGIPGLAVATRGPRLAAVVAFVSTGAYGQWLQTWRTNGLWRDGDQGLWPETERLLEYDPIRHVATMYPTAVLMVNGGEDKVVDPSTARAFAAAARPYYKADPDRLRLVVYEGFAHNLPLDVVKLYAEHWFRLYMHPTKAPPKPPAPPATLDEKVRRTQINAADHKDISGAGGKPGGSP